MSRIVLDTNGLIQILPQRSKYHRIWESFVGGENVLCVSTEILNEYFEIMQRLINLEVAEYVIKTIINSSFVQFIDPYYHFGLIEADPDDNKFVDCAIAANAQFIVTNDHHYNVLHQIDFPKVNVINIDDFLDLVINH